ncbi:DUF6678 family protein [Sinorhizobium meliloti]|uniref:DUF6678 family protein n=1 Tax=Rhizobium meliloti TaxID=382 RepID=UPI003F5CE314
MDALHPVMNNTKWDELRSAMHALDRRPLWRCKDVNGFRCSHPLRANKGGQFEDPSIARREG